MWGDALALAVLPRTCTGCVHTTVLLPPVGDGELLRALKYGPLGGGPLVTMRRSHNTLLLPLSSSLAALRARCVRVDGSVTAHSVGINGTSARIKLR